MVSHSQEIIFELANAITQGRKFMAARVSHHVTIEDFFKSAELHSCEHNIAAINKEKANRSQFFEDAVKVQNKYCHFLNYFEENSYYAT